MNADEFDRMFDEGADMTDYLDPDTLRRPNLESKRLEMDVPSWLLQSLDRQAQVVGVSREALIKLWLAERLHRRDPIAAE